MFINRNRAAELGRETVRILEDGQYSTPTGEVVEIRDLVMRAVKGTVSYPPDQPLPPIKAAKNENRIEVKNESTLAAARRLVEANHRPVALNFASAKHPGGGFLTGARAQEESLARSSALYACLAGNPMYEFHQARADPMYSSYAIYSPDVPVFRDDVGKVLLKPYLCSFITCPAVNAKVVREHKRAQPSEIRQAMAERIHRVLTIAVANGHDGVVLGAWGCGVFGNEPREIAELFQEALANSFPAAFARIFFAILDGSEDQRFIAPFRESFGVS
jgi:uncharacterized protein (TIGR02452 family)